MSARKLDRSIASLHPGSGMRLCWRRTGSSALLLVLGRVSMTPQRWSFRMICCILPNHLESSSRTSGRMIATRPLRS